jgi:hypothetical protein
LALRAFFNRFSNMDMKISFFTPFASQDGIKVRNASRPKPEFTENRRVGRYTIRELKAKQYFSGA